MADEYTIGELARQDIYPDETGFQPPPTIRAGVEDYAGLGGDPTHLATAIKNWWMQPSWLQKVGDVTARDTSAYQTGGAPAVIGQLADTSAEQDLLGGFGGNIKGVEGKLGAIADLAPHAPPFYSAVEQAVQGAKQTTAPGQQWAGFLRNQPGVKPEELNTLKLGDLFDQTGAVTKQDLLDHIAANKVQLGEVVKSEQSQKAPATRVNEIDQQLNDIQNEFDSLHQFTNPAAGERRAVLAANEQDLRQERQGIVANWQDQASGRTKFSQYTLPGGENYRETLLTLPTQDAAKSARMTEIEGLLQERRTGEEAQRAALRDEYKQLADETRDSGTFKSSHFDEPNILAHIRTNDRTIDGKKTLFVEEVQSDWHQKGKREGYADPEVEAYRKDLNDEWSQLVDAGQQNGPRGQNVLSELRRVNQESPRSGVPDAPFKTTWPDLAMKRVIREAAEGGYDKVAWTPGSVQADRYDLSKQIDNLRWFRNGDGTYRIRAEKDGNVVMRQDKGISENELANTVGKELAEKIVKNEEQNGAFTGLDLKVGGEGMKGFYDQILPAAVNKIVKKAGGRVGQSEINAGGKLLNETEAMPGRPVDVRRSERGGGYTIALDGSDTTWGLFNDEHAARARMSALQEAWDKAKTPVHTLDITPQLREMALKKGFPLFTAGGLVAGGAMGDLAKQDDYQ